ncbi:MAG: hypothetical protein ACKVOW_17240 [Chitinophagaceae bacterium]
MCGVINFPGKHKNILFLISLFLCFNLQAQKKWDGEGGDNSWNTASNWEGNTLPASTDDVLLDNSLVTGSYRVQLPDQAVSINSIAISPSGSDSIRVILPSTNTVIPGLTVTGAGGIRVFRNGLFINSSGGSPGAAIVVVDSIWIYNGARFIHNTTNSHASYISRISRIPGTERGVFEFDVPGPASYTISLSGRNYGSFELSSFASGGTKSYLSNGITTATIRGDFIINSGVNYSLDFSGDLLISGLLFNKGNFNLASGPNNNSIKIRGQLICSGTITESSIGLPVIELNGVIIQDISITGSINNSISIKMNNAAGAVLRSPVSLPYKLVLANGKIISTASQMLSLQSNCTIQADSTNSSSFIDGPLQKIGLNNTNYFLFPIGKGQVQRWIELKNATGNFTVEFFKNNPYGLAATMGNGIDHISQIEYWSIEAGNGAAAKVELSFDNVNSGGVTNVSDLRVAHLVGTTWIDEGNSNTTGSAGAAGSVTSNALSPFATVDKYFTLASSQQNQNPLPLQMIFFAVRQNSSGIELTGKFSNDLTASTFDIEYSRDGHFFQTLKRIPLTQNNFIFIDKENRLIDHVCYYRIHVTGVFGNHYYSNIIPCYSAKKRVSLTGIMVQGFNATCIIKINSSIKAPMTLYLVNNIGQLISKIQCQLMLGTQEVSLPVQRISAGLFHVFGVSSGIKTNLLKFFKP